MKFPLGERVRARLVSVFFSVLCLSPLSGTSNAESLKVGLTGKYPPFNYFTPEGELTGFDVDIAKSLCSELSRTCEFRTLQWDGILGALLAGRIDTIIASMAITPEREKAVHFTEPYYISGAQLFATSTMDEKKLKESGIRIGVTLGTTYGMFAKEKYPKAEIRTFKGDIEVLQDLQAGRLDAMITDKLVGLHMTKAYGAEIQPLGPLLFEERIGIAVKSDNPVLLESLNSALRRLKTSPQYENLWMKYFGPLSTAKISSTTFLSFIPLLIRALRHTLWISFVGVGLGTLLAILVASLILTTPGFIARPLSFLNDFVRSTPFMIQLFALYFGLPALGVHLSAWNASVLAIALHCSAYLSEIGKAAYLAVPIGQKWAAKAIGLGPWESLRYVVWPQMIPLLSTPVLNTIVAMIKDSAIVSVVGVHELTLQAQELISATFRPLELYAATALLYFLITYPLLILGRRIEKRMKQVGLLHGAD